MQKEANSQKANKVLLGSTLRKIRIRISIWMQQIENQLLTKFTFTNPIHKQSGAQIYIPKHGNQSQHFHENMKAQQQSSLKGEYNWIFFFFRYSRE